MTELQVGQPALIINVEYDRNRHKVGKCIIVDRLLSLEDSIQGVYGAEVPYASYIDESQIENFIQQRFLMPIPPLGDDILEQTNIVKQPEGETA